MKTILTAKIKLQTTAEQFQALRLTQLTYRDALNAVSQYAYKQGKLSNQQALQRGMYDEIRSVYGLPSQMARNVPRQVGATYKALWTVGARNITMRTLLSRQDWERTGTLSVCPDGSDLEAKAARLQRYAELRWSLDPNPRPSDAG